MFRQEAALPPQISYEFAPLAPAHAGVQHIQASAEIWQTLWQTLDVLQMDRCELTSKRPHSHECETFPHMYVNRRRLLRRMLSWCTMMADA